MKPFTQFVIMFFFLVFCGTSLGRAQGVTFYTDEGLWRNAVGEVDLFATTSSNLLEASEVTTLPTGNSDLGNSLSFFKLDTGLRWDFYLSTDQDGATFIFNNSFPAQGAPPPTYNNALSVGNYNTSPLDLYENDDWQIEVPGDIELHGFAFDLGDNDFGLGESLLVYDIGRNLLGTLTDIPASHPGATSEFIGVVSEVPMVFIQFDEGVDGDHISIANFRFASQVPEPSGIILAVLGLAGFMAFGRRWRKR